MNSDTQYLQLAREVSQVVGQRRATFVQALQSPSGVAFIHYFVVGIGALFIGIFSGAPIFDMLLRTELERAPAGSPLASARGFETLLTYLGVVLWILLLTLPAFFLFRASRRRRARMLLPYSLLIAPGTLALTGWLLEVWATASLSLATLQTLAVLSITLVIVLLGLVALIVVILGFCITDTVFLLLASTPLAVITDRLPDMQTLASSLSKDLNEPLKSWREEDFRTVETFISWRKENIDSQTQATSFMTGALALLALVSLVLSSGEINAFLNVIGALLAQLGDRTDGGLPGSIIIASFFVLLVSFSVLYFSAIYRELRTIELVGFICLSSARIIRHNSPNRTRPLPEDELRP